jgi:hypothetical protein
MDRRNGKRLPPPTAGLTWFYAVWYTCVECRGVGWTGDQ